MSQESLQRRRKFVFEVLGNKCAACGNVEDLEVDHIIPGTHNPSLNRSEKIGHRAIWYLAYEEDLLAEILKCQILCYYCHKDKSKIERKPAQHGLSSYSYGCRYDTCVEDHRIYRRNYYEKYGK